MSTYDLTGVRHLVFVCVGSDCRKAGALDVVAELKVQQLSCGLGSDMHVVRTRCMGRCDDGCNLLVTSGPYWYAGVTPKLAKQIVREHLRDGQPVTSALGYVAEEGRLVQVGSGKKGKRRD